MSAIVGNAIVIVLLAVVLFFSGRRAFRTFKGELEGKGCASCSGGCNCGCSGCGTAEKGAKK